jgi:polysaccharide biosynthesis/export protein
MGATSRTPSKRGRSRRLACRWALLAAGLLSGCATTGRYTAESLPDAYRARPTENVKTVELAKLASPTAKTDIIARGDVLELSLSSGLPSERDAIRAVRVDDNGKIYLSELGHIAVDGLELEAAEAMVASLCVERDLYRTPQITITMKQQKVHQVTVVGAVKNPDTYELRAGQCDLLSAIVSAGGLEDNAGNVVEIRHPGFRDGRIAPPIARGGESADSRSGIELTSFDQQAVGAGGSGLTGTRHNVVKVDLISATQEMTGGYQLPDGAIVNVERKDLEPIYVYGLVRKPGEYKFPVGKEMRLTSAIALAGDIANPLADKVYVIRNIEGRPEPVVVELSLKQAKEQGEIENLKLMPGDTVSVEKTAATNFYDTIRIIGFGVGGTVF